MIPRPYQEEAVNAIRAEIAGGGGTMVSIPTGGGKTAIAGFTLAAERPRKTLVLQHTDELIGQNRNTIADLTGRTTSVVKAERDEWFGDIVFASVQTLGRQARRRNMPAFSHLVIDECHRAPAPSYQAILKDCLAATPDLRYLGLTATPGRGDSKPLRRTFPTCAFRISIGELIEMGALVPPEAYTIDLADDEIASLRAPTGAADFDMGDAAAILNNSINNDAVVRHWKERADGLRTVAFCSTIQHASDVADAFVAGGVPAEVVSSGTSREDRRAILDRLRTGETRVVCNCMVLTEGFDCLDSETEILTTSGWRGRGDIVAGDTVMAMNMETGMIVPTVAMAVTERPALPSERMIRWNSQHLNVRVTEGHRMLAGGGRRRTDSGAPQFAFRTAGDLLDSRKEYTFPLAAQSWDQFDGVGLTNDEIRLAAWSFTDSYISKRGALAIYQKKQGPLLEIRDLLERLDIEFEERVRECQVRSGFAKGGVFSTFYLRKIPGRVSAFLRNGGEHCVKRASRLPDVWGSATRDQFLVFWRELLKGDGSQSSGKSGWLWTPSKALADDIMAAAIVRGLSSSVAESETKSGSAIFRVSVRERSFITSNPLDARSTKVTASGPIAGNETVWCVTNSLGTLVARRGGKAVVLGNCQTLGCIVILRPMAHHGTLIQAVGRGLRTVDQRKHPGVVKTKCIVLDFSGALARHGSLEMVLTEETDRKQSDRQPSERGEPGEEIADLFGAPISDFTMREISIIAASPFGWSEVAKGTLVTHGFDATAFVVRRGSIWHALGKRGARGPIETLTAGDRAHAVAAADDYMREHETSAASSKTRSWMAAPASAKQLDLLQLGPDAPRPGRYEACCRLDWKFNRSRALAAIRGI